MKLEHFGMAEPGDCRVVFTASAQELEEAIAAEQAGENPPADEEDLMAAAVNRAILTGFSPLYAELVENHKLLPVTDPDFELLAVNRAEGFRAGAQFFCVPPLELGRYTGFVQPIQPRPLRELTIELEINRFHGDEDRAADAAGKQALRERVTRELYAKRCEQGKMLAERELVAQLGNEVKGPLPKQLVAGNYFAEQRQFNLRMQANNINFDQYLKVQGQTVEEFRQQLHADAERKLRSRLGLLLGAGERTPLAHRGRGGHCAGRLGREKAGGEDVPRQRRPEAAAGHGRQPGGKVCGGALHPDAAPGRTGGGGAASLSTDAFRSTKEQNEPSEQRNACPARFARKKPPPEFVFRRGLPYQKK